MEKQKKNQNNYLPSDSVGKRMVDTVPLVFEEDAVSDVKKMLFERMSDFSTINYIYVINKAKKLIGVFSIKEIFANQDSTKISEIMKKDIIKVRPYTDQERAAILALKHNLKAIPVTDKDDNFLGVISSDSILDILQSENVEDFLKTAGIRSPLQKLLKSSPFFLIKARIPWLIFGLLGGIFAAGIVSFFETSLKANFILAAFMPLLVYMADAVGVQAEILFIRNSALDFQGGLKNYFVKEIQTTFLMALILGILLSFLSVLFFRAPYYIGIILGISLFATVQTAVFIGIFIPWILYKVKKDPAVGAGPFAAIIRDIITLLVYFLIASFMLSFF